MIRFLMLVFLLCSAGFAHSPLGTVETLSYFETKHYIFLHPFSIASGLYDIQNPELILYLTTEHQLSDYNRLIVHPSILVKSDYFRLGSGLGIRHYASSGFEGVPYLQLMPSVHYVRETVSGPVIDVLGYIGTTIADDCTFFFDVGIGYGWNFAKKNSGLVFDINFGVNFNILWLDL
jgi:hypothetical protein